MTLFKYLDVAACTPKPYPPNDNVTNAANAVRRLGALQMQQWEAMTQLQQLTHAQQCNHVVTQMQQLSWVDVARAAKGFGC